MAELNEAGIEAAAKSLFDSDGEMMGELSAIIPGGYPSWDDDRRMPESNKAQYREQARKVVGAYVEGSDGGA